MYILQLRIKNPLFKKGDFFITVVFDSLFFNNYKGTSTV